MSLSEKKVAANRQNAQKSTGPRTEISKRRIRLNALKHALYADPKNLPGEDPRQTSELVMQVRQQLQPQGPLEEAAVNQIISIIQALRRISRAYDAHLTARINRRAVSRQRRGSLQELEEILKTKILPAREHWTINLRIESIYETTKPHVQANDFDVALDAAISDEREVTVAANVDRRKRQLMRDLDDAHALLQDLQAARQPNMIVLPPSSDGDRTSMSNQIEAPQRLALRPSNEDYDKTDDAGDNAKNEPTDRS